MAKRHEVWRKNLLYPGWTCVEVYRWRWRARLEAWSSNKAGWTDYEVRRAA